MNDLTYRVLSTNVDLKAEYAKLSPARKAAAEAMRLHMRLTSLLREAIIEREQDRYRRTLRVFRRAARRLERRYNAVTPAPKLPLGNVHKSLLMPRPTQQPATQLRNAA